MKHTSRFFTKVLVGINVSLCWAVTFYATHAGQSAIATTALSIIAAVVGTYIGVGHLDYRQVLLAMRTNNPFEGTPIPDAINNNDGGPVPIQ